MQSSLEFLKRLARSVGLEINIKKTKTMKNSTGNVLLLGQIVEYVDSVCYLGSTMTTYGGAETVEDNRLARSRATFGRLHFALRRTYNIIPTIPIA